MSVVIACTHTHIALYVRGSAVPNCESNCRRLALFHSRRVVLVDVDHVAQALSLNLHNDSCCLRETTRAQLGCSLDLLAGMRR
jgi:hypothetical protein